MIRVVLPAHLKNLARVSGEVQLEIDGTVDATEPLTQGRLLDALEQRFPMLLGTIRDRQSGKRRAFLRFYACEEDLSNTSPDEPLPAEVASGKEPYIILGAMAGG